MFGLPCFRRLVPAVPSAESRVEAGRGTNGAYQPDRGFRAACSRTRGSAKAMGGNDRRFFFRDVKGLAPSPVDRSVRCERRVGVSETEILETKQERNER